MRERGVYQTRGSDTEEGVNHGHLGVGGERVGRGGGGYIYETGARRLGGGRWVVRRPWEGE